MDALFLKSFVPEIFLSIIILYQLLCNTRVVNSISNNFPLLNKEILAQCLFISFCLILLYSNQIITVYNSNFLFVNDINTCSLKLLIAIIFLVLMIIIWKSFVIQNICFFEYFTLIFLSLLGVLLLVNSFDLITAYLVIELQSLAFYILACFIRTSSFGTEAGLKYFVLGAFTSGLFLLGAFFFYITLGTLNFNTAFLLLSIPLDNDNFYILVGLILSSLFILATFFFKIAAVPFHFWAPDVYEGAPLSSTIILSLLPKFALFSFFIKWVTIFVPILSLVKYILIFAGILTVVVGSYLSITQKRLKRFVIYSSISQLGFLIVALSICTLEGFVAVYFFLLIYIISSIILWSSIVGLTFFNNVTLEKTTALLGNKPLFLSDVASYFKLNYAWSVSFLILFFSFSGIPPLTGFLSKVFVLHSLILNNDIITATVLIIVSVVSTFYYLRFIKIVFFDKKLNSSVNCKMITKDSSFFQIESTLSAALLFLLLYLFFSPSLMLLFINTIALGASLM
jgi:proton-translocating NADH-quinone oxidoreductase chain N